MTNYPSYDQYAHLLNALSHKDHLPWPTTRVLIKHGHHEGRVGFVRTQWSIRKMNTVALFGCNPAIASIPSKYLVEISEDQYLEHAFKHIDALSLPYLSCREMKEVLVDRFPNHQVDVEAAGPDTVRFTRMEGTRVLYSSIVDRKELMELLGSGALLTSPAQIVDILDPEPQSGWSVPVSKPELNLMSAETRPV